MTTNTLTRDPLSVKQEASQRNSCGQDTTWKPFELTVSLSVRNKCGAAGSRPQAPGVRRRVLSGTDRP